MKMVEMTDIPSEEVKIPVIVSIPFQPLPPPKVGVEILYPAITTNKISIIPVTTEAQSCPILNFETGAVVFTSAMVFVSGLMIYTRF